MRIQTVFLAALLPLSVGLAACDDEQTDAGDKTAVEVATPALEPGTKAGSFQLQAVVELVKGNTVADAKALEAKINDPEAKLHLVDVDGDKQTDFIEVIETKQGDKVVLEFRAIPSSKANKVKNAKQAAKVGVVVATIELEIEDKGKDEDEGTLVVHGTYSEHIEHDVDVHVYHHAEPVHHEGGAVVFAEGCFFHYVFVVEHEHYHGHHFYIDVHHDVHVDVHHHKHKKHKKHHGHHGHGHGHHKVHW